MSEIDYEAAERAQRAAGIDVDEPMQEDYFGFDLSHKWFLPDNVSFIEYRVMNEGAKAKFQRATNRDLTMNRNTQDLKVKVDQASERWELLKASVVGWNLVRQGNPISFTKNNFENWLEMANPKLIQDLEQAIRMANPWMQDEMTLDQINEERKRLNDLEDQITKRAAEKGSSSGR